MEESIVTSKTISRRKRKASAKEYYILKLDCTSIIVRAVASQQVRNLHAN